MSIIHAFILSVHEFYVVHLYQLISIYYAVCFFRSTPDSTSMFHTLDSPSKP